MSLIKQDPRATPPKQKPRTTPRFTYEARSAEQYLELLQTDPRPWWTEAAPRKRARFKNVKLTNALSSSATKPTPRASCAVTSLI